MQAGIAGSFTILYALRTLRAYHEPSVDFLPFLTITIRESLKVYHVFIEPESESAVHASPSPSQCSLRCLFLP